MAIYKEWKEEKTNKQQQQRKKKTEKFCTEQQCHITMNPEAWLGLDSSVLAYKKSLEFAYQIIIFNHLPDQKVIFSDSVFDKSTAQYFF